MTAEPAVAGPALYVYGITDSGAELPGALTGVQGAPVRVLVDGDIAAIVSELEDEEALGLPADLVAHGAVLDKIAADSTVLPMTFGTLVPDEEELVGEVLPDRRAAYAETIALLRGAAQFSLRARYVEETVLRELIEEDTEIARLRAVTADRHPDETHFDRIRLGELVMQGLSRKAGNDADEILAALLPLVRDSRTRDGGRADQVLDLALLIDRDAEPALEQAVEGLAERHAGRIRYRLLGPQAPYDFVGEG
jgi:Gas vesicle synthesis protein GvpL/GvpF